MDGWRGWRGGGEGQLGRRGRARGCAFLKPRPLNSRFVPEGMTHAGPALLCHSRGWCAVSHGGCHLPLGLGNWMCLQGAGQGFSATW